MKILRRLLPLSCLAALSIAAPISNSLAAPARLPSAPAVALPDTGVFAPVAAQLKGKAAGLAALPATGDTLERIRLLVATGRVNEASRLLDRVPDQSRDIVAEKARVRLVRQDYDGARAVAERVRAEPSPTEQELALLYAWLFARDDAATVDTLSRRRLATLGAKANARDWLAAGRVAYDLLDYPRADSCFTRALAARDPIVDEEGAILSGAHNGLALVLQKRRDWEGSLARLKLALEGRGTAEALGTLSETLVRLGRTDEAIRAAEWGIRLNPYHESSHYSLGNGYARLNYTQLAAAYPRAFADAAGRRALERADSLLAAGRRAEARAAYARVHAAHPGWVDALVRQASLDFEDGRFAASRDLAFEALRLCPEYGRAHAVLAKALEGQRFVEDVHRAGYEQRFAAAATPEVPGIERFILNWSSLSPRHQKRVALSVAPWKVFVPVLIEGGATFYIKPVYMLLSDTPGGSTLRDQRINYDSRLWDDVRGAGGYHTVTGIEDVERTIFDRYNTVLHELTHQVHAILPADDSRVIQEHYRRAKERDDRTKNAYLSRYAGGSVYEYFAEGANALESPKRDAWDPREVVKERLEALDPDLRGLVARLFARTDVKASYPVAYTSGGDDRVSLGRVDEALPLYRKALDLEPREETALTSFANALILANRGTEAESVATRAVTIHPTSGPVRIAYADARWQAGRGIDSALVSVVRARPLVRAEDRWQVDASIGRYAWAKGDAAGALAAYDSVIAYQSDNPAGLSGRAAALGLAARWDEAFKAYEQAVRMRTGVVDLRCDYARDLLRAGRIAEARAQLDAAVLLDAENPTAEALRGWAELLDGHPVAARAHARQALAWGPWSDFARIVLGAAEARQGNAKATAAAWAPVVERIERNAPPEYVFRAKVATWEQTHALPAVERQILAAARKPAATRVGSR
jgi:tetratricopeptide (TPR) repeat protein